MRRTNILELKPTSKQRQILKEMMLLSSCIYNMANYEVRQAIFKGEEVPSFYDLGKKLKYRDEYKILGRSYALPRIQIYGEMSYSRMRLIMSGTQRRVGLPKYLKNRNTGTTIPSFLVVDGRQYHIRGGKVSIPLSRIMHKKYDMKHFVMEFNGDIRWKGTQERGQIRCENGKFYLYQSVDVEGVEPVVSDVFAGIDLGIKNLITVVTNNGDERIIGSKRFLKQWEYHNKVIGIEQGRIAEFDRYSSNTLKRLYNKRKVYKNNLINSLVGKLFRVLKRNGVGTIFLGDVKGIRDLKNNNSAKFNRMLHNYWAFGEISEKIKNKAEENGISVIDTTEEYTSKECPVCKELNSPYDRIYVCEFCGYIDHRDIVGAKNIMIKGMRDLRGRSAHWDETIPLSEAII